MSIIVSVSHLSLCLGAVFIGDSFFGAGNGAIFLDDVICSGSESTILQCSHLNIGHNNCAHREDVSVHCSGIGTVGLFLSSVFFSTN